MKYLLLSPTSLLFKQVIGFFSKSLKGLKFIKFFWKNLHVATKLYQQKIFFLVSVTLTVNSDNWAQNIKGEPKTYQTI